jgi:hypothetical protein
MTDGALRSRPTTGVSRRTIVRAAGRLAYATPVVLATLQLTALADRAQAADRISGGGDPTCTPTPTPTPPPGGGKKPPPGGSDPPPSGRKPPVEDTNDRDDDLEVSSVRFLPNTGDGGSLDANGCG